MKLAENLKENFTTGIMASIPIAIGYIPISVTFGIVSSQSGISLLQAAFMSFMVFAGASQFMAVNMISGGSGWAEVVLATLVLNFRHLIMSTSLMNNLRDVPAKWKSLLCFGITDETFSLMYMEQEQKPWLKSSPDFAAGVIFTAYASWVAGTILGGAFADIIPASISASMSISLYSMFIGLLVPAIHKTPRVVIIVASSMIINAILGQFISGGWAIVLATLLGGLIGAAFERGGE
ncbi:4-azaleucine resistance transporter AzlC [Anaerobacterium chartisolvens]|uniref:4-azaleucine resistance transporter AzlC n=1 Tax=Anaerobacterium chartisolvens TaxID=1297424 RepID=A0A369AMC0_9FIRM|nr:AzlC family ABC transporter permease [Anaerobacterium chartisolvens]RCX10530.1 4-azaleucine resistance transporter AzlC [Anaerobacterium chartisolvens]